MQDFIQARVDEFDKAILPWKSVYKWKVTSFVALKSSSGVRLLFGRILFEPLKPKIKDWGFESATVLAGRRIQAQSPEMLNMYSGASNGTIELDGRILSLEKGNQSNLSAFVHSIRHPSNVDGPRAPHLLIYGTQRFQLYSESGSLERINWELKAADQPFNDIDDLFRFLDLPSSQQMGEVTTLEYVADYPALLAHSSKLKAGVATIECAISAALDQRKVKIGYVTFDQVPVDRKSIAGSQIRWTRKRSVLQGISKVRIGNAPSVLCFLSYDGHAMHQWWISDPTRIRNPYRAIYEAVDPGLSILTRLFATTAKDPASDLEQGVAILFSMLGMPGIQIGHHPLLRDGPDLLVGGSIGQLLVIECTTANLDQSSKLAKLCVRTEAIRHELQSSGHSTWNLLPVIVSSLPRTAIPRSQLSTAGENGVAVLTSENLLELNGRTHNQPDPIAIFREIQRWIPKKSDRPGAQT